MFRIFTAEKKYTFENKKETEKEINRLEEQGKGYILTGETAEEKKAVKEILKKFEW